MRLHYLWISSAAALAAAGARADSFPVVETTIADLEAAYQAGTATPADVVRAYLKRINQLDRTDSPQPLTAGGDQQLQPLNSYMHVNAHALHDANMLKSNVGPLFGIPVVIKSTHRDRIAENAQIFDFELSAPDVDELDALDRSGATAEALERKWW